ncbi:hypothetical protein BU26DRAFT_514947 [Trematosphaeria pertusa]|uniref:Uncharacterized protein n=1 Tax=Trematosphaeria pertusa TaxID=390896 RepID=A0A6A6J182_9PLEO|nr:uncharacterized protein BU26DRAFT_514947 [Trematosphaeria pertusa]KAF2255193.1 hypothetical protein BU26DRAFT_514947 [Trematosphaeria pertusa]
MIPGITDRDIPPVPPLSYWEPDTPEPLTSPLSPHNPFLFPPPLPSPSAGFPMASPILPASPLSIFDRAFSPMSPTFLFPRTPPMIPSEMSPRFLCPRTPPIPPSFQSIVEAMQPQPQRRHSTMCSVPYSDTEKTRHQQQYEMLIALRDKLRMEREKKQGDRLMERAEVMGMQPETRLFMGNMMKKQERKRLMKRKSFEMVKAAAAGA